MTPRYEVDDWSVSIDGVDVLHLAQEESIFGLANGHVGWRGNLDEGDPRGVAGSYLNGVFEEHPMPYAEDGYGYPENGQSVINVPNGQVIRLLVDDEPFDVRRGTVSTHRRRLDMRDGQVHRVVEWTSPARRTVRVESTRIVSLDHRSIAAVRYTVRAVDGPARITVLSEVLANEPLPSDHDDPRVADLLRSPLRTVESDVLGTAATLVHRTRESALTVAVSMDHVVTSSASVEPSVATEAKDDLARTRISVHLEPGETLEVVKVVGHEWTPSASAATLRDRAEAAVGAALREGWDGIAAGQRARLESYWECADVEVDGIPRLQQAVRFALFQVFQASARAELRSIPGKGLTGSGYEGHTFWDFEAFVLPVLTSTSPDAAEQALRWRHATLPHARERARTLRLDGAAFAWRTIDGRESSGYWPASTAAFHINAAVAGAVQHYVRATGDIAFERECGVEMLVETARLWCSLGRWGDDGAFHIDGVTGPDEYSAIVDDNVYTNVMARRNLRAAAVAVREHPDVATALGVAATDADTWDTTARSMSIPFDQERGVHPQSAGYTDRERWDFRSTGAEQYPLHSHFPYFDLYRKQVLKQADLVLALYFAHEAFSPEEKERAFSYYEELTVRDSSLSAAVQSVLAAEVGHLDLALDYLAEVATLDLDDLHGNTDQGLHIAALAGVWTAITAGLGGMRDTEGGLSFRPSLPEQIQRLSFGVRIHGHPLYVSITPHAATYLLGGGPSLRIRHFDDEISLSCGVPVEVPIPPTRPAAARPEPPYGRAPRPAVVAFGCEDARPIPAAPSESTERI
ncbi:glycosyl hydrolase family 65 protein [Microbacterium sp. NPDC028030]|uniref:glycoside hydrolase family 65 protein n=1 Tax=Microbacterium sp. NPDC028030 TaxID=3155124 RepID=UPI0033D753C7